MIKSFKIFEITRYKIFENINLDYNDQKLTSLPKLPNKLKKLWCIYNQLTSLPELPDNLKELYCSYNQLTSLPELPVSLKNLYCQYNQLSELPKLPDNLKFLICHDNNWKEPISIDIINKFDLKPYTNEQTKLFRSYEFQKEYIEKDNINYFNLEQKELKIHPRIKQEYINIDSIKDMGVL